MQICHVHNIVPGHPGRKVPECLVSMAYDLPAGRFATELPALSDWMIEWLTWPSKGCSP